MEKLMLHAVCPFSLLYLSIFRCAKHGFIFTCPAWHAPFSLVLWVCFSSFPENLKLLCLSRAFRFFFWDSLWVFWFCSLCLCHSSSISCHLPAHSSILLGFVCWILDFRIFVSRSFILPLLLLPPLFFCLSLPFFLLFLFPLLSPLLFLSLMCTSCHGSFYFFKHPYGLLVSCCSSFPFCGLPLMVAHTCDLGRWIWSLFAWSYSQSKFSWPNLGTCFSRLRALPSSRGFPNSGPSQLPGSLISKATSHPPYP